jgi:hypothetical protein
MAMKGAMLGHAFCIYPEVRFHIAPRNLRSQRAPPNAARAMRAMRGDRQWPPMASGGR